MIIRQIYFVVTVGARRAMPVQEYMSIENCNGLVFGFGCHSDYNGCSVTKRGN